MPEEDAIIEDNSFHKITINLVYNHLEQTNDWYTVHINCCSKKPFSYFKKNKTIMGTPITFVIFNVLARLKGLQSFSGFWWWVQPSLNKMITVFGMFIVLFFLKLFTLHLCHRWLRPHAWSASIQHQTDLWGHTCCPSTLGSWSRSPRHFCRLVSLQSWHMNAI